MAIDLIDQHKNKNGITLYIAGDDRGEGKIATGETILPGMAVGKSTATGEIEVAADGAAASGWAPENLEGTTLRTAFTAGDWLSYYRNKGDKFMALVASGQDLVKDAYMTVLNGKFVAATEGTVNAVAVLTQEEGTGGALGADAYLAARWVK